MFTGWQLGNKRVRYVFFYEVTVNTTRYSPGKNVLWIHLEVINFFKLQSGNTIEGIATVYISQHVDDGKAALFTIVNYKGVFFLQILKQTISHVGEYLKTYPALPYSRCWRMVG